MPQVKVICERKKFRFLLCPSMMGDNWLCSVFLSVAARRACCWWGVALAAHSRVRFQVAREAAWWSGVGQQWRLENGEECRGKGVVDIYKSKIYPEYGWEPPGKRVRSNRNTGEIHLQAHSKLFMATVHEGVAVCWIDDNHGEELEEAWSPTKNTMNQPIKVCMLMVFTLPTSVNS